MLLLLLSAVVKYLSLAHHISHIFCPYVFINLPYIHVQLEDVWNRNRNQRNLLLQKQENQKWKAVSELAKVICLLIESPVVVHLYSRIFYSL